MKRPLLIILGIIIVLILLGIWVYVLLTGNPNNGERFNEFGFGDTTDQSFGEFPEQNPTPVVDVSDTDPLRQLTTKPVAGFTQVHADASSTPKVQYVESGTGHIYTIDLETGDETRVSATTIPLTTNAAITPNGKFLIVQAGEGQATEHIIGTLATSSDELSNFALAEPVSSFAVTEENEILYATPDGNNTLVKAYNPVTNSTRNLFTIPFRDMTIQWHRNVSGPHVVYPKAASRLEGFLYSFTDGTMNRLPISGYGLSAVGSSVSTIYSNVLSTGEYVSGGYNYENNVTNPLPISIIPEKCAFSPVEETLSICGASLVEYSTFMPDVWYRGELTNADSLWQIRPLSGTALLLEEIPESRQQSIDIINPQFTSDGTGYYFQNKIDNTLWMYDLNL